jgi:error-prone DNA polymerase
LQDTLTAIRLNRPVTECGFELTPNAEQHLRSRLRLANVYPPDALAQTLNIASRCTFMLDELRYEYPDELVPPGTTPTAYLRRETYLGAQRRYPRGIPHSVQKQIEHELSLIADLKYEPYFLTVYDIVRFARNEGILCQGRGPIPQSAFAWASQRLIPIEAACFSSASSVKSAENPRTSTSILSTRDGKRSSSTSTVNTRGPARRSQPR